MAYPPDPVEVNVPPPTSSASTPSFLVRGLVYAAVLLLDLAGGIAFGWHFALGGAAGGVTGLVWLWVNPNERRPS